MAFRTVSEGSVEFNGNRRMYDVVDRNVNFVAPRYFISYNGGRPSISDEVPEEYREPMVVHELTEFETLAGQEGRCADAFRVELKHVSPDALRDYLNFRREAFLSLLGYLEDVEPKSELISELRGSLAFLESIA